MKNRMLVALVLVVALTSCVHRQGDELIFTGSVEADEVDLSSEVSGIIESIAVQDGDAVTKDTLILQLNTKDYELKLKLLENAKAMAELSYIDLEDGNSENQIRAARANVRNTEEQIKGSKTELVYLRDEYSDLLTLFNAGASSQKVLDQAKRLLDREEAKLKVLYSQKESYDAQLALVLEGATDEVVERALLQVKQKEIEIEDLKRVIEKSTLISPINGYVQNVNYQIGEWISPGVKAVTIIDSSKLWIKIYVSEKNLHKVKINQKVEFLDDFLQGKGVEGKIKSISQKAEFTPKNIESKENKQELVFEVRIEVDDPSDMIKPGMFLDVRLAGE